MGKSLITEPTDEQRLEWLARHVSAYSHTNKTQFGFDFNSARVASEKYYEDFRREVDERMRYTSK